MCGYRDMAPDDQSLQRFQQVWQGLVTNDPVKTAQFVDKQALQSKTVVANPVSRQFLTRLADNVHHQPIRFSNRVKSLEPEVGKDGFIQKVIRYRIST